MWDIIIPKKILKNIEKYPKIQPVYQQFIKYLTTHGPYLVWYPNYGKLKRWSGLSMSFKQREPYLCCCMRDKR